MYFDEKLNGVSTDSVAISTNIWYHFALTVNSYSVKIYINGVLRATADFSSSSILVENVERNLNRFCADHRGSLKGHLSISDFMILDRSINNDEVLTLMNLN